MKACVLEHPGRINVRNVDVPVVQRGWVLVRVRLVGICGTDLALYQGKIIRKLPLIPGHEVVGIVEDVGPDVPRDLIGHKVVFEINITCGQCTYCRSGLYMHCTNRKAIGLDIDGGMAEYVTVPAQNLLIVDDIPDEDAVLIEPLAALVNAAEELPRNIHEIAILGQGPLAFLAAQLFKAYGLDVKVIGKSWNRLSYFKKINNIELLLLEEVQGQENKFDAILEATGSPTGIDQAIRLAKPRGIILAKSTHGQETSIDYTKLVIKELRIVGTRCGLRRHWEEALRLVRKRLLKPSEAITHTFPLDEAEKAFTCALERKGLKIVIKP